MLEHKMNIITNIFHGAINISLQDVLERIEKIVSNKNSIIILYCEHGGRSKKALGKLEKLGYNNLYNLEGGISNILIE